MITLEHVCVVYGLLPDAGRVGVTAIDKRPVPGAVQVGADGVRGDVQCDRKHHGGRFRAVYVVSDEDAAVIEAELGRSMPVGWMGENFRVSGVMMSQVLVGERWRVGDAEVVFTEPRVPCGTFARYVGEPSYVKRFTRLGRPGALGEVITPGSVRAGSPVEVIHRPAHGLTIGMAFENRYPPAVARALLEELAADDLSPDIARKARASLR